VGVIVVFMRKLIMLSLVVIISGCSMPMPRTAYEPMMRAEAPKKAFRFNARAGLPRWREHLQARPLQRELKVLSISGGAEDGAFGAGVLTGWSETGRRPEFDVVVGVSTGALISVFAFLGPAYDRQLAEAYTSVSTQNIASFQPLLAGIFGQSVLDSSPLRGLIESYVTPELVTRVAAEHRRGRRLFVLTTNLDTQHAVVWNMGRIANAKHDGRLKLFRDVILASASIPGVFPPVMIRIGEAERERVEMHVDGGTIAPLFAVPEAILTGTPPGSAGMKTQLYVLINGRLESEFELIEQKTLAIAERSLSTMIKSKIQRELIVARAAARAGKFRLRVASIGDDAPSPPEERFNHAYMRALFESGLSRVRSREAWSRYN